MTYKTSYTDPDTQTQMVRDCTPEEVAEIEARKAAALLPQVPESVTPRQFREALIDSDLFDAVDGAVAASADRKLQNWWEFTTAFERNHHLIAPLAESLGVTDAQLDALWVLAGSL